jgi:hypothetical protein
MKKTISLLLLTLVLTGCRSTYDLTLTNGVKITGVTKPQLNKETGQYVFQDAKGRPGSIPEMRVRAIEPHEETKQEDNFRATQTRGPR